MWVCTCTLLPCAREITLLHSHRAADTSHFIAYTNTSIINQRDSNPNPELGVKMTISISQTEKSSFVCIAYNIVSHTIPMYCM